MTPREFKAWFDGFTEAMSGTPTKDQWKRIKAKVAEIDGEPITEKIFIDRYWPRYPYYYWTPNNPNWVYCQSSGSTTNIPFNSTTAMYAQGKIEASEMGATS